MRKANAGGADGAMPPLGPLRKAGVAVAAAPGVRRSGATALSEVAATNPPGGASVKSANRPGAAGAVGLGTAA